MSTKKLNVNQISAISSHIDVVCPLYEYKEAYTFMYFWGIKEGYYYLFSADRPYLVSPSQIENDGPYICKDKKVYYKPYVLIKMVNGDKYEKYFDTETQVADFMNSLVLSKIDFVVI